MSLLTNKIDDFDFLALIGHLVPPVETVELDQRPAFPGTEVTRTAVKGKPFQVMTRTDAPQYSSCHAFHDQYKALIGQDPVTLVQGGVSTNDRGFKVAVLNVEVIRALAISGGIGGFYSSPRGLLECRWDLIAIANSDT